MPFLERLRVFCSPIHHYGVRATAPFAAGELIAVVEGVPIRRQDLSDDTYCLRITDDLFYDMADQTRWINHSCEPNASVRTGIEDSGEPWARIVALRAILEGEEITYHYAFPADLSEPCRCASRSCPGWIVDPAERDQLLARVTRPPA